MDKKLDWHMKIVTRALYYASENILNLETLLTKVMAKGFISTEEYERVVSLFIILCEFFKFIMQFLKTIVNKGTKREKHRCMMLLFEYKSEKAFG